DEIIYAKAGGRADYVGGSLHILTANCCTGGATTLERYQYGGGYTGLRKAFGMQPQAVIAELKAAGLLGRGGAVFPTGSKWEAVASVNSATKYVVVNADESEPGTFKDRILLETDPHLTLEGMITAAYSVGAHYGYIYVRGEYAGSIAAMEQAITDARRAGLLGQNILGSGFDFEVELRQGAGAYICGEETALFESIEGKRGFPRMKPPYPSTHGLFGKPTLINNVETLCNIPFILLHGAGAFRQYGTPLSPGPKLFCVSGDVNQPGLFEAPLGITLRQLLYEMAGGIRQGRQPGAVLLGGAAGSVLASSELDVPLTFEDLRNAGLTLGSGAVMVFDETRDLREVMLRLGRFFAHESCGKCYPCQMGTQRQSEILARIASGQALPGDAGRLADVGWTMTDASLCGLGQTAATAVLSALERWPELFAPQKEI
ncbi:MAG TPA: NADH-ubiquinone oxidoreductase-F iron-sulfur binding region domain-containing protein, partial [Anaerolineales bacterium]